MKKSLYNNDGQQFIQNTTNSLINSTSFKLFLDILKEKDYVAEKIINSKSNPSSDDYTKYRKLDIFRTFISLLYSHYSMDKLHSNREQNIKIQNDMGLIIKNLIMNVEKIGEIKNQVSKLNINADSPNFKWIENTYFSILIDKIDSIYNEEYLVGDYFEKHKICWQNYSSIEASTFLGNLPDNKNEFRFTEKLTPFNYSQMFYCLLLRALLIKAFKDDLILLDINDEIKGQSGTSYHFDGILQHPELIERINILKLTNIGMTSIDILHRIGEMHEDIGGTKDENFGCIVFIPSYPSSETQKTQRRWQYNRNIDISILYLPDLYELIWMTAYNNDYKSVRDYLIRRVR